MALLEIKDLHTHFKTQKGIVRGVDGVSLTLWAGETLGVVGESGSGKSVTAMSILRLLDRNGSIEKGEILFDGRDLVPLSEEGLQPIRGREISVIFQEPMTSLNPVFTVERQVGEAIAAHERLPREALQKRVVEMLQAVQIPNPQGALGQYPHQLSGGMRQRVMIAMALACRPRLLIADEPTTALDVTIQAQILRLIGALKEEWGTAVLFITHDLSVIRQMAQRVAVLYCGQVVEEAPVGDIFREGGLLHPYTRGLLRCRPRLDTPLGSRLAAIPGTVPNPLHLPTGCRFSPRCPKATQRCGVEEPPLLEVGTAHSIRCFDPDEGVTL